MGGAQEMLGLTGYMSGIAMGEVTGHFREAFYRYNTVAAAAQEPRSVVRYATRTALLLAEYARTHGQFAEAHSALMRAHFQVTIQLWAHAELGCRPELAANV